MSDLQFLAIMIVILIIVISLRSWRLHMTKRLDDKYKKSPK